jgi:hydrogenase-1 operon protein HyaF
MSELRGIPIAVANESGNVPLLLHQVRHALEALLTNGNSTTIDLRAIPLAPGEPERLLETLGNGEVRAEVEALGRSVVYETSIAGVWVVEHFDQQGALSSRFIEVATVPEWLHAGAVDMREGLDRLTTALRAI